jgi:hypothetical protein
MMHGRKNIKLPPISFDLHKVIIREVYTKAYKDSTFCQRCVFRFLCIYGMETICRLMYVCRYVRTHACMLVWISAYLYLCIHICMCAIVYACIYTQHMYYVRSFMYVRTASRK